MRELLEHLRERGVGVLLNSHLLSEIELVCDRVAIIDHGEVVAAGRAGRAEPRRRRGGGDGRRGTRVFPDAGREDAPRIVRELVAAGEEVYAVRVLTSTLEDAYLEAVGGEATTPSRRRPRRWAGPSTSTSRSDSEPGGRRRARGGGP